MIFFLDKSHMHMFNMLITYVQNFKLIACKPCEEFQIGCLETLGGVDYTNLLPHIEAKPKNCLSPKCRNFVKNNFRPCLKSHARLHYAYNIGAKFQIDCLQTLGGVDYTNLLPYVED